MTKREWRMTRGENAGDDEEKREGRQMAFG